MNYEISWEKDESDANLDGSAAFVPGVTHLHRGEAGRIIQAKPFKMPNRSSKPPKRKEQSKHVKNKDQGSLNHGEGHSKEDPVSLKNLRPEDKKKIANLIKELAKVGEEKEVVSGQLQVERKQFEVKYLDLDSQMESLKKERGAIQQQYLQCQRLLTQCQERLAEEQMQHVELLKVAQKDLSKERKVAAELPSQSKEQFHPHLQSTARLEQAPRDQSKMRAAKVGHPHQLTRGKQQEYNKTSALYTNDTMVNGKMLNAQSGHALHRDRVSFTSKGRGDDPSSTGGDFGQFSPSIFSPDEFHPLPEEIISSKDKIEEEEGSLIPEREHKSGRHPEVVPMEYPTRENARHDTRQQYYNQAKHQPMQYNNHSSVHANHFSGEPSRIHTQVDGKHTRYPRQDHAHTFNGNSSQYHGLVNHEPQQYLSQEQTNHEPRQNLNQEQTNHEPSQYHGHANHVPRQYHTQQPTAHFNEKSRWHYSSEDDGVKEQSSFLRNDSNNYIATGSTHPRQISQHHAQNHPNAIGGEPYHPTSKGGYGIHKKAAENNNQENQSSTGLNQTWFSDCDMHIGYQRAPHHPQESISTDPKRGFIHHGGPGTHSLVERQQQLEAQKVQLKLEQDWLRKQLGDQEELLHQKQLEMEAHQQSVLVDVSPARPLGEGRGGPPRGGRVDSHKGLPVGQDASWAAERMEGMGGTHGGRRIMKSYQSTQGDVSRAGDLRGIEGGPIRGSAALHSDSLHRDKPNDPSYNATIDAATSPLRASQLLRRGRRGEVLSPAVHHPGSGLSREDSSAESSPDESHSNHQKLTENEKLHRTIKQKDSHFLEELIDDLNSLPSVSSDNSFRGTSHPQPLLRPHYGLNKSSRNKSVHRSVMPATSANHSRIHGSVIVESSDEEEESRILDDIFFLN